MSFQPGPFSRMRFPSVSLFALVAVVSLTSSASGQSSEFVVARPPVAAARVPAAMEIESGPVMEPVYEIQPGESQVQIPETAVKIDEVETLAGDCETCLVMDHTAVTRTEVIKNANLFGIPDDACCDEWSGFCRMRELSLDCSCGGLKAKKGHFGIPWFRSADAGEDCDYCQGGCCSKSNKSVTRQRNETRLSVLTSGWKNSFRSPYENCNAMTCGKDAACKTCK